MSWFRHFLRRATWSVPFALVAAFMLASTCAQAQFPNQSVCTSGTIVYEDQGWDGGDSDAIDQTVCLTYDNQSGLDSYVETDNDYYEDFYSEYGDDNLWTYGVAAEAQLAGFDVNNNYFPIADTGMIQSSTDFSGAQSAHAEISSTPLQYLTYQLTGLYAECESGYGPSNCYWQSNTGSNTGLSVTLAFAPTLSLTTSATPTAPGQPAIFTVSISSEGELTGTVTFYDANTAIGWGEIKVNIATFTTSALSSGSHSITASWPGDSSYAAVTSNAVTQVINQTPPPTPIRLPAASIINTVAGDGRSGYTGDGGPATASGLAELDYPHGVAMDSVGNLYIADTYNNRIRKVTAVTGVITTVAGNGNVGYAGDGGAATSARLSYPFGVMLDPADNLYIADTYNNVIRKVAASTGLITTVVGNGAPYGSSGDGGPATSAELNDPTSIAMDSSGNLYIADSTNNRVRKVTAATGIITTVAGNSGYGGGGYWGDGGLATSAGLNSPMGVMLDSADNLYIADYSNQRVRKMMAATGIITTVAGSGSAGLFGGYSGDGGAATEAKLYRPFSLSMDSAGNLYIADSWNNRIRQVAASTGIITTVAGGGTARFGDGGLATSAELSNPFGVIVDPIGNLYIADAAANRIRKVAASTKTITTVAGDGRGGYSGDGGIATAIDSELNWPQGVAADSAGNLYIADTNNNVIRKVTASSAIITTVAGVSGNYGNYSGDGGPATAANMSYPYGVAVDSVGNLYIADTGNSVIRKVAASTGVITTVAGGGNCCSTGDGGAAVDANLNYPQGVAVNSAGDLYIADTGNSLIRKVTASTGVITTVAGDQDWDYYGDGGSATSAALNGPAGVAVDSAGNLYIADQGNSAIRKIAVSTGIITTVAGNGSYGYLGDGGPAANAELSGPTGVAVDSAGNLYIADTGNSVIRRVAASTGTIATVAGNGAVGYAGDAGPAVEAKLNYPGGVAVDLSGYLYLADSGNNRVRAVGPIERLTGTYPTITTVLGSSPNPSVKGQLVIWTALVVTQGGPAPTGTVTFVDSGSGIAIGGGQINAVGIASTSSSSIDTGTHMMVAIYSGDGFNQGSSSQSLAQLVQSGSGSPAQPAIVVASGSTQVAAGSTLYITTAPAMPPVSIQIPGLTNCNKVTYSLHISDTSLTRYEKGTHCSTTAPANCVSMPSFSTGHTYTPPQGSLPGDQPWTVNWATWNSLEGGDATLTWQVDNQPQQSLSFTILGLNPGHTAIKSAIATAPWFYTNVVMQESSGYQFAPNPNDFNPTVGYPLFGPPSGYGVGQIDPPTSDAEFWNWRTNIQDAISVLNSHKTAAYSNWPTQLALYVKDMTALQAAAKAANPPRSFTPIEVPIFQTGVCNFQCPMAADSFQSPAHPGTNTCNIPNGDNNENYVDADWIHLYNGHSYTAYTPSKTTTAGVVLGHWNMNVNSGGYVTQVCQAPAL